MERFCGTDLEPVLYQFILVSGIGSQLELVPAASYTSKMSSLPASGVVLASRFHGKSNVSMFKRRATKKRARLMMFFKINDVLLVTILCLQ